MTERINTITAEGESGVWAIPAGTLIQLAGVEGSAATVELWGRADAAAPFAYIGAARVRDESFMSPEVAVPQGKLVWHSNTPAIFSRHGARKKCGIE